MITRCFFKKILLGKLNVYIQKNDIRPLFSSCIKIDSKWAKDFNISPETMKLLKENGRNISWYWSEQGLFEWDHKAQETDAKINGQIKLKRFCTRKKVITRAKRQPIKWEKILVNYSSNKGLIFRCISNSKQLNTKSKSILL